MSKDPLATREPSVAMNRWCAGGDVGITLTAGIGASNVWPLKAIGDSGAVNGRRVLNDGPGASESALW